MDCGIIGLPNVGKTALFNLLTSNSAPSSNYPYCTVEPNTGVAVLNDRRIDKLKEIVPGAKVTYPHIKFVDIAGLPPGASEGEGLGNQFLSNIRDADVLLHVIRAFNSTEVSRFDQAQSTPQQDLELIQTELFLSDMEIARRRVKSDPIDKHWKSILESLENGIAPDKDEEDVLLTPKQQIIVLNITTGMEKPEVKSSGVIYIDVAFQQELAGMTEEEANMFRDEMVEWESAAATVMNDVKKLLNMVSFYTLVGGREIKGYNVPDGTSAFAAAGKIHTDIQKGFIKARVFNYIELEDAGFDIEVLKKTGKVRTEGRGYIIREGDIVEIMFN
ncbi:MAG: DUF933 domain-containing protein [Elusimicrobiota bacterium]